MTLTAHENTAAPGREPGRCRYPGCPDPARASDAPGRPPGYCGQEIPEDRDGTPVLVRHTAMTAFRRRRCCPGSPGTAARSPRRSPGPAPSATTPWPP